MVASLTGCMDLAIVSGFTLFLPKYLETQFGVTKSDASILTGSVAVPGACIGIFLGGWLLRRKKLQLRNVAAMVVCINLFCLSFVGLFFIFGCSNPDLVGMFKRYDDSLLPRSLSESLVKSRVKLWNPCNSNCSCEKWNYVPVCGSDQRTYFSPCFAGCEKRITKTVQRPTIVGKKAVPLVEKYTNCNCIPTGNLTSLADTEQLMDAAAEGDFAGPKFNIKMFGGEAHTGSCPSTCHMIYPFLIGLFLLTLIASNNQMPLVMVTLRAVSEDEKAFALGLQVVFLRLLAYIPAPILFGAVIDSTCMVWKPKCAQNGSTCLLYDIDAFRLRYGFICLVLKVAATCSSLVLWWCIKRRGLGAEPFSPPITMSEIAHRLGDVDNLHIRGCRAGNLRAWLSDDSLYSRPRSPRRHQKNMSC